MLKNKQKQTIAVIDKEVSFFDKLVDIFRDDSEVHLEHIESRKKAKKALTSNNYDLYLINYKWNNECGVQLLIDEKSKGNFSPVIVYGKGFDEKRAEDALRIGIADYFDTENFTDTSIKYTILHTVKSFEVFQDLFNSEARYKNLMETLPVMFYAAEIDSPYKPIYMSKAFENLGHPIKDWYEKPGLWLEMVHPDDLQEVLEKAEIAKKEGGKLENEYRVILKDGSIKWINSRSEVIRSENGENSYWQGLCIDITEKKLTEESLRESESRYRELFENANDLLYVHDFEGRYLSVNKTAETLFGYTKEEALKLNLNDVIVPEYLETVRNKIAEKIAGKENSIYEIECFTKSGNRITLEINSRIMYVDGQPFAVQGVARDITFKKEAKVRLVESEERFRDLFENANDLIYTHDLEGRMTSLNHTGEMITGYSREEAVNLNIAEIVTPESIDLARDQITRKLNGEPPTTYELEIFAKDRSKLTLEVSSRLTFIDGEPVGVQGIARDVTEKNRLINERDRFYKLSLDLLATVDSKGRFTQINPAWKTTLGFEISEVVGKSSLDVVHPDDVPIAMKYGKKVLQGENVSFEIRLVGKDGQARWIYWGIIPVLNENICYAVGRDITQRKLSEQRLEHNAMHDTLTNLPNRAHFIKHLELAIERSKIEPRFKFAVLFLDLDRFKIVNDSLGHVVGDKLLIAIAERLKSCVRPSDVIARLGGDEFTILVTVKDERDAILVAERLQEKLTENFKVENYEVFSSASIGIILSDVTDRKPEDFLRDADTAMYRAKEAGKARYEIFDREMHIRNMNLLQVETDLRRAIERDEFVVHYQPIVDIGTGEATEFEALIRWNHPEHGLVYPNEFISIAEETGLIVPIGEWILRESCRQVFEWQEKYGKELCVSVNLSTKQLMNPNLSAKVSHILNETGLSSNNLKLEVTESSVMDFSDTAFEILSDLRRLGVGLSTDDFGTGYSSLSYLHKYPFQRLKIDRSFINGIQNEKSTAIIRTILILGQNLGIEVVAEGIETDHQLRELIKLDCKLGQGYLFSRPVDSKAIGQILGENLNSLYGYKLPSTSDVVHLKNTQ